jgi:hypothetical protein
LLGQLLDLADGATDARAEAENCDLHRDDPEQGEGDERDPGATTNQAIE